MSHDNLEQWLAQERTVRERMDKGAGPGVARPDQVAGKTGLEVMQGLLSGELPYASIAKTLNFVLIDVAPGHAVFQGAPGRGYTTADLSVKLVKALTPKVQRVRAIGQVVHCGRQLATAEARLVGPDGTLYAHASTACLVFEMPTQSKP